MVAATDGHERGKDGVANESARELVAEGDLLPPNRVVQQHGRVLLVVVVTILLRFPLRVVVAAITTILLSLAAVGGRGAGAQQSTRRGVDAPNLPPLGVVGELEVENVVDAAVHGLVQVERAVRGEEHEPRVALHDRQQRRGVGAPAVAARREEALALVEEQHGVVLLRLAEQG